MGKILLKRTRKTFLRDKKKKLSERKETMWCGGK
jgi:hypothetical protein